jgi:hypothetical protein
MKKIYFFYILFLTASFGYAQNVPVDFETGGHGASWSWNTFENSDNPALAVVTNPSKAGINTSDKVGQFTARATGQPWAGCESMHGSDIGTFTLDSSTSSIKIMVYKTVISDVGIKLVEAGSGSLGEKKVPNTKINEWEELTFDFSSAEGIAYDQIVVFMDFNLGGRTAETINHFDNITFTPQPPKAEPAQITFRVDMKEYTGTLGVVNLNGTFNGWCGNCNVMTDDDNDKIYEITLPLEPGVIDYKFTVDAWTDQENFAGGEPCTTTKDGFTNRTYTVDGNYAMPAVCFNSCGSCATSNKNNVTFSVNLKDYTDPIGVVNLNGTFNGWCGGCTEMYDNDKDSIYELIVPVADTIEYKYTIDAWTAQEALSPGTSCTKTEGAFTNRYNIQTTDTVLSTVCWNSCDDCSSEPTSADVTFMVDMKRHAASGGTWGVVNLNGTFNDWCGACTPMVDVNSDSIFSVTVNVPLDTMAWKYTLDAWAEQENFTGDESCVVTVDGFSNRSMVVTKDTVLQLMCYNKCVSCDEAARVSSLDFTSLDVYPNPATGTLYIDASTRAGKINNISLVNIQGLEVYSSDVNNTSLTSSVNVSTFASGVYFLKFDSENGVYMHKVIIQ